MRGCRGTSRGCLLAVIGLLATPLSAAAKDIPAFSVAAGQRQLFLDNHGVADTENLTRTWHKPAKRGAVIRSSDPNMTIQTRSAPQWDPVNKVYKIWVLGTKAPLRQSTDGLHWTAGPSPSMRTDQAVIDPLDSDPRRRFKAAMTNRGFAISPDGARWTRLDVPVVRSADEANFSFDPAHGLFIHTVKRTGPYGRSVAIAHSRDFKNWTDLGVVFHADEIDQVIGQYGGHYSLNKEEGQPDYLVDHSTYTYLIDQEGKVRFLFRQSDGPELMAAVTKQLFAEAE